MRISLGDLADRLTICMRKIRLQINSVTEDEIKDILSSIEEIFETLSEERKKEFFSDLCTLADLNYQIWHLEFHLRTADETDIEDAIAGQKGKQIRKLNSQRNGIRSKMNMYSNTGYRIVNL